MSERTGSLDSGSLSEEPAQRIVFFHRVLGMFEECLLAVRDRAVLVLLVGALGIMTLPGSSCVGSSFSRQFGISAVPPTGSGFHPRRWPRLESVPWLTAGQLRMPVFWWQDSQVSAAESRRLERVLAFLLNLFLSISTVATLVDRTFPSTSYRGQLPRL